MDNKPKENQQTAAGAAMKGMTRRSFLKTFAAGGAAAASAMTLTHISRAESLDGISPAARDSIDSSAHNLLETGPDV